MQIKRLVRFAAMGALTLAAPAADFSYYVLSLSYAPEFCGHAGAKRDPRECGPDRPAFVVHGLWPQNESGRSPEKCAPARPVAADIVGRMLSYFPTESLLQHEWAAHGTCSGRTPAAYFDLVRRARDSVRIPPRLENHAEVIVVSPFAMETEFAQNNPGIPPAAIRTACYPDAGLEEVRVCFDKGLTPRACTGLSECTKLRIRLLPVPQKR